MAIKKLTLTEDHIKLIGGLTPVETDNGVAYDVNHLWGGSYLYEDMAMLLGFYDEHIKGTENDYDGRRYPEEKEKLMKDLYDWFVYNIAYLETLIHQFAGKGGLTPGTYKCIDYIKDWEKVEE